MSEIKITSGDQNYSYTLAASELKCFVEQAKNIFLICYSLFNISEDVGTLDLYSWVGTNQLKSFWGDGRGAGTF